MKIQYKGTIINGHGAHSGLGVPGRSNLQNVPDDWPKVLAQGSLNILVSSSGYPDLYNRLGIPSRVSMLDTGFFE